MKNKDFSQVLLKFFQRFKKFNSHELVLLGYMVILCIFLLFVPIIKITSLGGDGVVKFKLFSGSFVGTMIIVLLSLIVLIGWNFSTKFKNLFLIYFGGRENDSLVSFLFLFIIITAFLSVKNAVNIASSATSTISFTGGGNFILLWLLVGIVFMLISVVKGAQKTGKKTKIINVVDGEHSQVESMKEEIKKGLFDKDLVKDSD